MLPAPRVGTGASKSPTDARAPRYCQPGQGRGGEGGGQGVGCSPRTWAGADSGAESQPNSTAMLHHTSEPEEEQNRTVSGCCTEEEWTPFERDFQQNGQRKGGLLSGTGLRFLENTVP